MMTEDNSLFFHVYTQSVEDDTCSQPIRTTALETSRHAKCFVRATPNEIMMLAFGDRFCFCGKTVVRVSKAAHKKGSIFAILIWDAKHEGRQWTFKLCVLLFGGENGTKTEGHFKTEANRKQA